MKNNIKEMIKKSGYTQKEIAEKLNTTEANISGWSKGTIIPRLDNAYKLSKILKCSLNDLIEENPPNEDDEEDEIREIIEEIKNLDKNQKKLIKVLAKDIKMIYTTNCCDEQQK